MFDRERLDAMVTEGWLRSQRHPDADLWIYNYTEKTQFDSHWTPETLACRGLILDAEGGVIARPFPKFFNLGDPQLAEIPTDEPFTVREKIDGSLGVYYELSGEPHLATRGSFTSEQALEGTRMLRDHDLRVLPGTTPLFEIIYPENRIVVDYGERRALVLLTAIDHASGLDTTVPHFSGERVACHPVASLEALAASERPNCEGYVVTFVSGLRVKIKHAEYVRLHRIVTEVNARHIWEALRNGDDLDALLDGVPDEIHKWIDSTMASLIGHHHEEELAALRIFNDRPSGDRREVAEYFLRSGGNAAVLFRMLDGKPYDDLIWKAIKPEPSTPEW
jgi:RNA ligase